MTSRRLAAALIAAPLVLGLAACSSDEPESNSTSSGDDTEASTPETADLSDVPVEDICTSLGVVYDWLDGAIALGGTYPDNRDYLLAETPAAIEAMRSAAAEAPDDLAAALNSLADKTQVNVDKGNAATSEAEFNALLITPDADIDSYYLIINDFSDPQCGFTFVTT